MNIDNWKIEELIREPDTIPQEAIDACARQIRLELGLEIGISGCYQRIIAATLKGLIDEEERCHVWGCDGHRHHHL